MVRVARPQTPFRFFLGMIPEDKKQAVLDNLVGDIREHGVRLTTGDVGNRYLFRALADKRP